MERNRRLIVRVIDSLLLPYLNASSETDSDEQLGKLLNETARPVIRRIVQGFVSRGLLKGRLPRWLTNEDVISDVLVKLMTRLHSFKANPREFSITNFRGLTAVSARRILVDLHRETNPARTNLEYKVRCLVKANPDLAIWKDKHGEVVCGYAKARTESNSVAHSLSRGDLLRLCGKIRIGEMKQGTGDIILMALQEAREPVKFADLISVVAACRPIEAPLRLVDADSLNLDAMLEWRARLRDVLAEMRQLTLLQRQCLLLNLKELHGVGIEWFLVSGIASDIQLAELLGVSTIELADFLIRLPMTDKEIGKTFGLSARKVANVRKSVRERLDRRFEFLLNIPRR